MKLPCGRAKPSKPLAPHWDWERKLKDYLASQKLKHSHQRFSIAKSIIKTGGHLTAQDLIERVKSDHPGIGAATVYRNIKVLCEADILKETLVDAQSRVVYEFGDQEHHDHIVCLDCDQIFEFHSEPIEKLQSQIVKKMGFEQIRHRHVLYAHCEYKSGAK